MCLRLSCSRDARHVSRDGGEVGGDETAVEGHGKEGGSEASSPLLSLRSRLPAAPTVSPLPMSRRPMAPAAPAAPPLRRALAVSPPRRSCRSAGLPLISEVFAVLADMDCGVVKGHAWTYRDRLGCLVFLRDEETDTERMARIEVASDTSSAATPTAPAASWPPSPSPPSRTLSAASTSSCRPTVEPAELTELSPSRSP
uniref:Uncharacterized protein n=1 Tax=Oryza meridionalis TaxID=40149 RepID=A0A0E0CZG5_9ORYZ